MKKRRRKKHDMLAPMPATPHQRMKWSAESMARTALEEHPKIKRAQNAISEAVMAATEKALSKTLKGKA